MCARQCGKKSLALAGPCCTATPSGRNPRPSRTMHAITWAMTWLLVSLILEKGGNNAPSRNTILGSAMAAKASAAVKNASSEMLLQRANTAAWPSAGNTYALLACAGRIRMPSPARAGWLALPEDCDGTKMGSKGEPEANSTRPSVCLKASSKVHSDLVVGLDRGKMMGRWLMAAISRRTSSLKLPAMVDTPMMATGFSKRTASNKVLQ
mmetsp:Transcript_14074/g.38037  ORF Transcript_14074/g.38037 Transcript_14074/m.38037 type:complete len:209 (-) Transcript_14074:1137-1763(-)